VAAPPFDSLADFSGALRRFEHGERSAMVRGVYLRATAPAVVVDNVWQSVALPFAATVLAGVALIGAGETMHVSRTPRPARAVSASLDAQPIVFNPPPTIANVRQAVLTRATEAPVPAPVHRQTTARPRGDNPPTRHAGFLSRVLSRIRIKVEEL
jgi:hypothetical protein